MLESEGAAQKGVNLQLLEFPLATRSVTTPESAQWPRAAQAAS